MAAVELILLQRVEHLGQMGDIVRVKPGYARNYLLPERKALRATKENRERFDQQRAQLEAQNLRRREEAERVAERVGGLAVVVIRQAGELGGLYGSVSARDIAEACTAAGLTITRQQVVLGHPIKTLGLHQLRVVLHPEVSDHRYRQCRAQSRRSRPAGAWRAGRGRGGGAGSVRLGRSVRARYRRAARGSVRTRRSLPPGRNRTHAATFSTDGLFPVVARWLRSGPNLVRDWPDWRRRWRSGRVCSAVTGRWSADITVSLTRMAICRRVQEPFGLGGIRFR